MNNEDFGYDFLGSCIITGINQVNPAFCFSSAEVLSIPNCLSSFSFCGVDEIPFDICNTNLGIGNKTLDPYEPVIIFFDRIGIGINTGEGVAPFGGSSFIRDQALVSADKHFSDAEFADIHHEGISRLSSRDFKYAQELGFAIKLLAIAKQNDKYFKSTQAKVIK